jgi:hypothetical protein
MKNSNTLAPEPACEEDAEINFTDKNVDLEQRLREMKKLIDEQRLLQAELKQDLLQQK